METHSSILAREISRMEELGGLQSMELWAHIQEEKLDFYLIILKTREATSLAANGGDFTFQRMGCGFDPWLGS